MDDKGCEVPMKKRKVEEIDEIVEDPPRILESFKGFEVTSVISENARSKTMSIHGKLDGEDAIVMLEKKPFDQSHMDKYMCGDTSLNNTLKNDIYGTYEAFLPTIENAVKAVIIHPATEKHLQKYSDQERYVVHETAQLYKEVTLPLLENKQFSMQWVYNILDHKQEADRIVFEDPDTDTGFILLPDMKWDRTNVNSLYLVAIVHKHGIKSLRDLDQNSLPLLRNILNKGQEAIKDKYNVAVSKLNVYIHYQPSYYHLHVHFTNIKFDAPGFGADRAHLLSDVIENIELSDTFYKRKTLTYLVREQDDLYKSFKQSGYFDQVDSSENQEGN